MRENNKKSEKNVVKNDEARNAGKMQAKQESHGKPEGKCEKQEKSGKNEKHFWEKQGFFVAILVGMVVLAGSVIITNLIPEKESKITSFDSSSWEDAVDEEKQEKQEKQKKQEKSEEAVAVNADTLPTNSTEKPTESTPKPTLKASPKASKSPDVSPKPTEQAFEDEATQTGEITQEEQRGVPAMTKPLDGTIIKGFSEDELVYSATMKDWRVHQGADFGAGLDTPVKAVADGKVEEAYEDDLLGMTVVIGHSGGIRTLYANLKDISSVTKGATVKGGDEIGKVGNTATLEALEDPHLHFEIIKDTKCIDPKTYIN
ncbi:MAG: M23 family metallopeptidase [Oscillospiraceae bacterium]